MLTRKDKYFVLSLLILFQGVCMVYQASINPILWFQIDMLKDWREESEKALLLPVAFIFFGELLLLFSCLQRQLGFFNLLSLIGIGALGTTVLLLGIVTTKPLLVFGTALPFVILSVLFIVRMWRKMDMEKYIVHERERERQK
jgi:hypothetical protein